MLEQWAEDDLTRAATLAEAGQRWRDLGKIRRGAFDEQDVVGSKSKSCTAACELKYVIQLTLLLCKSM